MQSKKKLCVGNYAFQLTTQQVIVALQSSYFGQFHQSFIFISIVRLITMINRKGCDFVNK